MYAHQRADIGVSKMRVVLLRLYLEQADLKHSVGDHLEDLLNARCTGVGAGILWRILGILLRGQAVDVLAVGKSESHKEGVCKNTRTTEMM